MLVFILNPFLKFSFASCERMLDVEFICKLSFNQYHVHFFFCDVTRTETISTFKSFTFEVVFYINLMENKRIRRESLEGVLYVHIYEEF